MTTTLIGAAEAAQRLGVRPVTLRAWRMRGTGPAHVIIANRALYETAEIERYAALRQAS